MQLSLGFFLISSVCSLKPRFTQTNTSTTEATEGEPFQLEVDIAVKPLWFDLIRSHFVESQGPMSSGGWRT